jgi:hypothetical protein
MNLGVELDSNGNRICGDSNFRLYIFGTVSMCSHIQGVGRTDALSYK